MSVPSGNGVVLLCGRPTKPYDAHGECAQVAGARTKHPGEGACWLHGGNNPRGADSHHWKHGRYSEHATHELAELIAEAEDADFPFDTRPELALARALFTRWLRDYDLTREALHNWNEEYKRATMGLGLPQRLPDLNDALPFVEIISKAAKRERDTITKTGISRDNLRRLIQAMREAVEAVADADTAEQIADRWKGIRI